MHHILVLGGTTEAGQLARAMAERGMSGTYSLAGRTADPVPLPLPGRIGGFGGIDGLIKYLQHEAVTHVIDATHPFAAQISTHAVIACAETRVPLLGLQRAAWVPGPDDRWTRVADTAAAAAALPELPSNIFLAIGRTQLEVFTVSPQHHYLLRLVDPPLEPLPLPNAQAIIARGPFGLQQDLDLLRTHKIDLVIAKNAGGDGARAKLDAARILGLPVTMIDRPMIPERPEVDNVAAVLAWLDHDAYRGV